MPQTAALPEPSFTLESFYPKLIPPRPDLAADVATAGASIQKTAKVKE
jgi:hypothetical protein